jgi:hypothetical protein
MHAQMLAVGRVYNYIIDLFFISVKFFVCVQVLESGGMVGKRWLKRCIGRLLCSRAFRHWLLVGLLFVFTLLVIVARLDPEVEASVSYVDRHTFVLQVGI